MSEHLIKLILENERRWKNEAVFHQPPLASTLPPELAVMQLAHVLIGTIVWWLESEKPYTSRQMAIWFHRFAFYGYPAARGYEG